MPALLECVEEVGAAFDLIEPEEVTPSSAQGYDGVIASGGSLPLESYREVLAVYSELLDRLDRPFLGICLGLKILGHHYGARMRRIAPAIGLFPVHFHREYPLAPGLKGCRVYQGHRYELLLPLPDVLENYASDGGPVQAIQVKGLERYGVQFHPEKSEAPARAIMKNFVSRC
jgi:para-aminobenzoate synthetase